MEELKPPTEPTIIEAETKDKFYKTTSFWIIALVFTYITALVILKIFFISTGILLWIIGITVLIIIGYLIFTNFRKKETVEVTETSSINYSIEFLRQEFYEEFKERGIVLSFILDLWNQAIEGAENVGAEGKETPITEIWAKDLYDGIDKYVRIVNMNDKNLKTTLKNPTPEKVNKAKEKLAKSPEKMFPIIETIHPSGEREIRRVESSTKILPEKKIEQEAVLT